jgi:hypothetical protein
MGHLLKIKSHEVTCIEIRVQFWHYQLNKTANEVDQLLSGYGRLGQFTIQNNIFLFFYAMEGLCWYVHQMFRNT